MTDHTGIGNAAGCFGQGREEWPDAVSELLGEAWKIQATDIHVDPAKRDAYRICFRVDGVIHPKKELSTEAGRHLVNQIKVAARFSPDRTFVPLENRISVSEGEMRYEVRVTILPTTRNEAVHLRLLSSPAEILQPTELGLSDADLSTIRNTLKGTEGLILLSGPTGAGKTMTLYSLASFLELPSIIAVSVEDPVEFDLPYMRQIQADAMHNFSMSRALKTVLRMDPDLLLIGEIRDAPSAKAAVRAATSGRFVLATIHAADIPLAVESFHYFSVPGHAMSSALRLAISQVLVRRVCDKCVGRKKTSPDERHLFRAEGLDVPSYIPEVRGCERCHGFGYRGQTGVFQVVAFDRGMASAVSTPAGTDALRERMAQQNIPSLRREALSKVAAGVTTLEEVEDLHFPGSSE